MVENNNKTEEWDVSYKGKKKLTIIKYIFNKTHIYYIVIIVGDTSVGKSSILSRYAKNRFNKMITPTVALEFCAKVVKLHDGTRVKAQIWDTAGQEKYRSLVIQHYRKSIGALLVYDLTRKSSFNEVQRYLDEIHQYCEPDCVIYLIGNKLDLIKNEEYERAIPLNDVTQYAKDNGLKYIETSAYSDMNITDSFYNLLEGKKCCYVNKINIIFNII